MITTISTLPAVPNRNDPATFSEKADALLGAMPTLVTELNSFVTEVNTLSFKSACKCATTSNINLNTQGTSTTGIDGAVTLQVGDRVLVRIQNNSAENGIYAVGSTAWTRAADMDTPAEVAGSFVPITFGTTFGGKIFYTTFNATGATLGVTAIPWNSLTDATITGVGTLSAANGGTGNSSYSVGDLLYASGATTLTKLAAAASGNVLKSGTAPSWGKVALASDVSGTLPVANGGTGISSTTGAIGTTFLTSNGTGGWVEATIGGSSITSSGLVQLATDAEVATGTVSNKAITPSSLRASALVKQTHINTPGGTTSIPFTSIPSWVKRITVMIASLSTNSNSRLILQIGSVSDGGYSTTGYSTSASYGVSTNQFIEDTNGTGFALEPVGGALATSTRNGVVTLHSIDNSTWLISGTLMPGFNFGIVNAIAGRKQLNGSLDRLRILPLNTTDTFDVGGIVNIIYE